MRSEASAISVMPIMMRKPSASITTVGFAAMKRESGSAAISITVTAVTTAITMIGTCSVMPTAVMIESIEKTRSSTRIWPIAAAKPMLAPLPAFSSGFGSTV